MKFKHNILLLAAAVLSAGMVSCDDDFDRPPVIVPEATIEANMAISEFKELFWSVTSSSSAYQTIPVNEEGDSIILGGRIVSSDEYGNVYMHLILEDESGAIDIRVYGYDLYESYQYGQDMRINVTGLLVGSYGGMIQIGVLYNGSVGGMDTSELALRAQRNGLPDTTKIEIPEITIGDLYEWGTNTEKRMEWGWKLVKFTDVHFDGGGELTWATVGSSSYTTRKLVDASGQTVDVRTSDKCDFPGEILPKGTGSLIAILGYYNSTWQLTVMDPASACVDGFEFVDTPENSGTTDEGTVYYSETFKSGQGDFTIDNVTDPNGVTAVWKADTSYGYMIATGYANSANYANDSWLISPVIDLTEAETAYINYDQALNYFTSIDLAKTQAAVAVREEGSTEWTTFTVPGFPTEFGWTFVNSGDINISSFAGKKVQVGFHYTSTSTKAGTWELKNFEVKSNGTDSGDSGDSTDTSDYLFEESFGSSQGEFTIDNVLLPEALTYIWTFDSAYGMKASAYINDTSYASDSYLISPVIDMSAATKPVLTFDHVVNKFPSLDQAKTFCTLCVRLEGATEWTNVTIPTYSTNSNWTFVSSGDIDLSAYAGKKIQIAFHYTSADGASGTWEVKNIKITK